MSFLRYGMLATYMYRKKSRGTEKREGKVREREGGRQGGIGGDGEGGRREREGGRG